MSAPDLRDVIDELRINLKEWVFWVGDEGIHAIDPNGKEMFIKPTEND